MPGERMAALERVMGAALDRIARCFDGPRRLSIVIVKPGDVAHEHSIVFGSLEPGDLRAVVASGLLVDDEPPRVVCAIEPCTSTATHGPAGEAVVCWSHAGEWTEVTDGAP